MLNFLKIILDYSDIILTVDTPKLTPALASLPLFLSRSPLQPRNAAFLMLKEAPARSSSPGPVKAGRLISLFAYMSIISYNETA